jgi:hypothetical protein
MNHNEWYQLIERIGQVWVGCDENALARYYDAAFEGIYYGKKIKYHDLLERIIYLKESQSNRDFKLNHLIVEGNSVAIRFHFSAVDAQTGVFAEELAAFYEFNDDSKIIKAWAFACNKISY